MPEGSFSSNHTLSSVEAAGALTRTRFCGERKPSKQGFGIDLKRRVFDLFRVVLFPKTLGIKRLHRDSTGFFRVSEQDNDPKHASKPQKWLNCWVSGRKKVQKREHGTLEDLKRFFLEEWPQKSQNLIKSVFYKKIHKLNHITLILTHKNIFLSYFCFSLSNNNVLFMVCYNIVTRI